MTETAAAMAARIAAWAEDDKSTAADAVGLLKDAYLVLARVGDPADPWRTRTDQLATLLGEVASARRRATVAHAEAYLAADGTQQYRAASADLAAAAAMEELETLAGRAEAFRVLLYSQARTDGPSDTAGPAWPRPPEPDVSDPPYRGAV